MVKVSTIDSSLKMFLCTGLTTTFLAACGGGDGSTSTSNQTLEPQYAASSRYKRSNRLSNTTTTAATSATSTPTATTTPVTTTTDPTTTTAPTTTTSTATGSTVVAPYYDVWPGGKVTSLVQARQLSGLSHATIGFAFSNGSCAFDPVINNMFTDIRDFTAAGGTVTLSFGGGGGVKFIETACTDENQLFNVVDNLIQQTGVRRLDFDVEGAQISDTAATTRRTHVLASLQAKYPGLYVSLTLPVAPSGLIPDALNIVKSTVAGGVRVDLVNIMTMDYEVPSINWGDATIQSAQSTFNQLKSIFPNKVSSDIYRMIGITPMIGLNDDGTVFNFSDATKVTEYVKTNRIGQLSYWAFQRDQAQSTPGTSDIGYHSGVVQTDFQYYQIFKSAQ